MNDRIARELRAIASANGGLLLPRDVVTAARNEDSPLHACFEWNDGDAAESWRLHQARQLIRVVVTYARTPDEKVPYRVFVSLTPDRVEGGYRLMADVLSDEARRLQLLDDAREDMRRFQAKYAALEELAEVFAAMAHVEASEAVEHPTAPAPA